MRTKNSYSFSKAQRSCARNLWFTTRPLGCKVINFSSGQQGKHFTLASFFYWNITSCSSRTPKVSGVTTTRTSLFLSWLTLEILDQNIPERVQRNNPRVVKKPGSKFRSKQVKHRGTGIIMNTPVFIVLSTA
jgi:hypothetical protein